MKNLVIYPFLSAAALASGTTGIYDLAENSGSLGSQSSIRSREPPKTWSSWNQRHLANDGDADADDESIVPSKRDCKVTENAKIVSFHCNSINNGEGNGIEDKIEFDVETRPAVGAQVHVKYDDRVGGTASYGIVWNQMIEYVKLSSSSNTASGEAAAYDSSSDTVVQTLDLSSNGWTDFSSIVKSGTTSTFNATSGPITLVFTVTTETPTDNSTRLTANQMKVAVHIYRFPWQRSDSYLALIATVNSEGNVTANHASPQGSPDVVDVTIDLQNVLQTSNVAPFGSFTWATEGTGGSPPTGFSPNTGPSSSSSSPTSPPSNSGNTGATPINGDTASPAPFPVSSGPPSTSNGQSIASMVPTLLSSALSSLESSVMGTTESTSATSAENSEVLVVVPPETTSVAPSFTSSPLATSPIMTTTTPSGTLAVVRALQQSEVDAQSETNAPSFISTASVMGTIMPSIVFNGGATTETGTSTPTTTPTAAPFSNVEGSSTASPSTSASITGGSSSSSSSTNSLSSTLASGGGGSSTTASPTLALASTVNPNDTQPPCNNGATMPNTLPTRTVQIVATTIAQADTSMGLQVAFSFVGAGAHSDYLYWDPEIGVGYSSSSGGSSASSGDTTGTTDNNGTTSGAGSLTTMVSSLAILVVFGNLFGTLMTLW